MSNHKAEECPYCRVNVLRERPPFWERRKISIIISSGILFLAGLIFEFLEFWNTGSLILFGGAAIIPGIPTLKNGISALQEKRLDVNILMVAAAIGAFSIGYGAEGAAVLFLFYIAEFLEDYAGEKAKRSVAKLLELSPETAVQKTDSGEKEVHIHEVEVGTILIIRPGERIPLDGKIAEGSTSVNQSPVTGESTPVAKSEGDEVFAGTLNEEGYIEIEVTKPPEETTLSKIIELVRNAQERKSETQRLVNKIAKYYTPAVLVLALAISIIPVLLFSQPEGEWIYRALVLLAVSCPCAFVLSTPISMISGITSGAKNGVLIKGGEYIEKISRGKVLAIDKTRTLTYGTPEVTDLISLEGSEKKMLRIAISLESKTTHPLSKSIIQYGKSKNIEPAKVEEFESTPGKGIEGIIEGEEYFVGSRTFFEEQGIEYPKKEVKELETEGKTVILVGNKNRCLSIIALKDKLRKNAKKMIKELKKNGIETVMLTGDNERVAKAIAGEAGIDEFHSGLLPQEKVQVVKNLLEKHTRVMMVGDGVNDAPALAEADVGIAMGAAGSDIAIETSDVILMEDDLSRIVYLRKLGSKTLNTVKENITISILVKIVLAILAVLGLMTLSAAVGIGDMGISFLVILNALNIGRMR